MVGHSQNCGEFGTMNPLKPMLRRSMTVGEATDFLRD
jgi:hypothetical protein